MLHLKDYNFLVYFPIVGDSITQLMRHALHRCNYSTHPVVLIIIAYIFIDIICMLVGVSRHSCWCYLLMDMGEMGEEEEKGKGEVEEMEGVACTVVVTMVVTMLTIEEW